MKLFDEGDLVSEILREAKIIKIPSGAAQPIAERVAKSTAQWAKKRTMITDEELNERIALETEKYNADLAYVFRNRGKII